MNGFSKVRKWDTEADWEPHGIDVDAGAKSRREGPLVHHEISSALRDFF